MKGFSFFCGIGGSTQGYKKAGINMIGGCDIDKKQLNMYKKTFKPKHVLEDSIKVAIKQDIPYLYDLDLFDGSPPCTNFTVHNTDRHKNQNKAKKYFVMENVDNLYKEYASYLKYYIYASSLDKEYRLHFLLLNSYDFGLYTQRKRFFLVGIRRDLGINTNFEFEKKQGHSLKDIWQTFKWRKIPINKQAKASVYNKWKALKKGNETSLYGYQLISTNSNYIPTITTKTYNALHPKLPKALHPKTLARIQGLEHDFKGVAKNTIQYMVGMSVPPVFTCEIGKKLKELNDGKTTKEKR